MIKKITLDQDLGDQFNMFYTMLPADQLSPLKTLPQSISEVNQHLDQFGRTISTWPDYAKNEAARLMWVNWMFNNLKSEPIRKPILVYYSDDKLKVICGDTRLMTVCLSNLQSLVPVIVTCCKSLSNRFQSWTQINSNAQLLELLNFDKNTTLLGTEAATGCNYKFSWFEIADPSTAHHLHDESHRIDLLQQYLDQQPSTFEFSPAWEKLNISWHGL
jgi:hypothetical protein